jgi:hypothetical protein
MIAHRGTLAAATLILALTSGRAAAQNCQKISGKFSIDASSACPSFFTCVTGEFRGDLKGTFRLDEATAEIVGSHPRLYAVDSFTQIETRDGIVAAEVGTMLPIGVPSDTFAQTFVVYGGSGGWLDTTGVFTATGTFHPTAGGAGDYAGEICTP